MTDLIDLTDVIRLLVDTHEEHVNEKRHDLILCWDNGLGVKFDPEGKPSAVSIPNAATVGHMHSVSVYNGANVLAITVHRDAAAWLYSKQINTSICHIMQKIAEQAHDAVCERTDSDDNSDDSDGFIAQFFTAAVIVDPTFECNDTHGSSTHEIIDAVMHELGFAA